MMKVTLACHQEKAENLKTSKAKEVTCNFQNSLLILSGADLIKLLLGTLGNTCLQMWAVQVPSPPTLTHRTIQIIIHCCSTSVKWYQGQMDLLKPTKKICDCPKFYPESSLHTKL